MANHTGTSTSHRSPVGSPVGSFETTRLSSNAATTFVKRGFKPSLSGA